MNMLGIKIILSLAVLFPASLFANDGGKSVSEVSGISNGSRAQEITNSLGMKLRLIKPGKFVMGSQEGFDDEVPVHTMEIDHHFYIGIFEVTQEQWSKLMAVNPSRFVSPDKPVERIFWNDALEFLEKLSEKEGMRYRLPTETEWEYACRAGSTTKFYWGEDFDGNYCWVKQNSPSGTQAVGQKKPNAWGLYDMSGNVNEWCSNIYGDYDSKTENAVVETYTEGKFQAVRGGSWYANEYFCRSAFRNQILAGRYEDFLGFRILMEVETDESKDAESDVE